MNKAPTTAFNNIYQTGVGLIEVLVALIIMSVGLLGIASLYVTALQAKTTSLSRMKAVNFAQDMADRIRTNPSAVSVYALGESSTATQTADCAINNCSNTEMAQYDQYQWDLMIKDTSNGLSLPGQVKRSITVTDATSNSPASVTISLSWQEKNSGDLTYALKVQI